MEHETGIVKLVTESLANRLGDSQLEIAHLEAGYRLSLAELEAFKAVLESDPALKELFEEVKGKMTNDSK